MRKLLLLTIRFPCIYTYDMNMMCVLVLLVYLVSVDYYYFSSSIFNLDILVTCMVNDEMKSGRSSFIYFTLLTLSFCC